MLSIGSKTLPFQIERPPVTRRLFCSGPRQAYLKINNFPISGAFFSLPFFWAVTT